MNKENNLEFYMVKPSLKQIYGKKISKDTEFDEWTDDKSVHQVLKDLTLKTTINKQTEFCGIKSAEQSELVQRLTEGTILLWNEEAGYIIPNCQVCTIEELLEEIKEVKKIYKGDMDYDAKRDEA